MGHKKLVPVLVLILIFLAPSHGISANIDQRGTVLANVAASMKPGTWAELTAMNGFWKLRGNILDAQDGTARSMLEWADKAAWDSVKRRFIFLGGSHSAGSRAFEYDEAQNAWSTFEEPPEAADIVKAHSKSGRIMHAYQHVAIAPELRKLYLRNYGMGVVDRYDLDRGVWDRHPNIDVGYFGNCCGALEYFPELGALTFVQGGFGDAAYFDQTTSRWVLLQTGIFMGTYNNFAVYSPVHKVILFGGGNDDPKRPGGSRAVYKLDSSLKITRMADAPVPLGIGHGLVTVDPVSGQIMILSSISKEMYSFDVMTNMYKLVQKGSSIATLVDNYKDTNSISAPETFNIVATPVSTHGVIMFVKYAGRKSGVYLYRHSPKR